MIQEKVAIMMSMMKYKNYEHLGIKKLYEMTDQLWFEKSQQKNRHHFYIEMYYVGDNGIKL